MDNTNETINTEPQSQEPSPIQDINGGTVFKEKESKVGPLIGSIIIIIIIVVGGIYFLSTQVERINTETQETVQDEALVETTNIGEDLNDLNLNDIDAELDAIDAEFDTI